MQIRRLTGADFVGFKVLRLQAVASAPRAISYTIAEIEELSPQDFEKLVAPADVRAIFGAFDDDVLVAIVGIRRELLAKLRHKVNLWGVFTADRFRRQGISRGLIEAAVKHVSVDWDATFMTLAVDHENDAAKSFYRSLGFTVYGTSPKSLRVEGRDVSEDLMSKDLPNSDPC